MFVLFGIIIMAEKQELVRRLSAVVLELSVRHYLGRQAWPSGRALDL